MAKYLSYSYLYPPRPEQAVPVDMLKKYEQEGWWWQAKMNGTCTVIFTNGKEVIFKSRHDDDHKQWAPNDAQKTCFRAKSVNGTWSVFVAELIHNKTKHVKDRLYVFDILVHNGEHLIGMSFKRRQALLEQIMPADADQVQKELFYGLGNFWVPVFGPWVCRARNFNDSASDFMYKFADKYDEVEGVVMKAPEAALQFCKKNANSSWQVKSRKEHKNYGF
jgi:hypothetical protein